MQTITKYSGAALAAAAFLLISQSGCGGRSSESSLKTTIDPLTTDFKIGRGIDVLNGKALGDCVITPSTVPAFDAQGKEYTLSINKIESSKDLFRQMGMAAKSKYAVGGATVSGKTSFTEQFAINSQSLFLSITVKVTNPLYTISNVKLKTEAIDVFSAQGGEGFRRACGDEFVRSFTSGGEFIAVLEIHTDSQSHKKAIDQSLKGSYGNSTGSISFSQNLEDAISENQTDLFLYQSGGSFEHLSLSADALIRKAMNYPDTVTKNNSRPIIAYTASYKTLLNFPHDSFEINIDDKESILDQLANDDLTLSDMQSDVDYDLAHPNDYEGTEWSSLKSKSAKIKTTLKTVRTSAKACVANYKDCSMPHYQIPGEQDNGGSDDNSGGGNNGDNEQPQKQVCVLWLEKDGAPYLKPKSVGGVAQRKSFELGLGKTYKYTLATAHKNYTCKKVQDGIQTLNVHLETLGYGSDKEEVGEIIYK